jgi:hypothetical protein
MVLVANTPKERERVDLLVESLADDSRHRRQPSSFSSCALHLAPRSFRTDTPAQTKGRPHGGVLYCHSVHGKAASIRVDQVPKCWRPGGRLIARKNLRRIVQKWG